MWCPPPHLSGLQLLPCCRNPSSGAPASNNPELLPGNPCPIPAKPSLVPALRSVSSSSVTSNCFICLPRQLGQDRPQLQKIKVRTSSISWWISRGLWYLRWRIFEQDKQLPIPRPPPRRKLGHRLVFSAGPPHKSNPNLSLAMLPFHTLSPLQKENLTPSDVVGSLLNSGLIIVSPLGFNLEMILSLGLNFKRDFQTLAVTALRELHSYTYFIRS